MDKKKILQSFIQIIEEQLLTAIQSQKTTVAYVTDEDNKPENEYDTRGLEASYLARGQAERVADLKECLSVYKNTEIINFKSGSPIGNTALIELLDLDESSSHKTLLLMPIGGGLQLSDNNKTIQTVTATSPIGQAILKKKVGDLITYSVKNQIKEFEIISVL